MKSPSPFQRLIRTRTISFVTALALHLGWALALGVLLMALRREPEHAPALSRAVTFVPILITFAVLCAASTAAVWGLRQQAVRWIRGLGHDDLTASLAATCTGLIALSLVALVALGVPSLSSRLSRGEMDIVMFSALMLIGVIAVSIGWLLIEGLVGTAPRLPGRIEASLSQPRTE
jgi:hypothetical protein